MSALDFTPIDRASVAEKVAKKLLDLVRSKNLTPGSQLPPERELALSMQVSRPSVREAVRGLQILGVLKVRQGGGIYVSSLEAADLLGPLQLLITLNEENVNALYESRRLIDGGIGRMAAERITDANLDRLKSLLFAQKDLLTDPVAFRVSDLDFHRTIAEVTGNPFLVRVSISLYVLGMEYRRISSETPGVLNQSFADHHVIIAALERRDGVAAEAAMVRHMSNVHGSTVAAMETQKMTVARIGIIGAGWWAVENHIPLLKANPDCELVAVNRLGAADLERLQQRFAIPHGFEDYRDMLANVPLDGVIVASPHVLHHEHALAAIRAGCHVLVEKPLATTAADAREIVAEAETHGREVIVPYGWNFKPYSDRAAELVAAGRIGRVEHVVLQMASALEDLMAGEAMAGTEDAMFRPPASTWADPQRAGGYGWGQLVHALGLLFKIADLVPASVFAATGRSPAGVDFYDAAVVRFEGGATAALSGASTVPKHRGFQVDLRIFGSEGMLLLDVERERLEVSRRDGTDEIVPIEPGAGAYACVEPVRLLVDVCRGLQPRNGSPGTVGMRAVEVLDALYRSAESGRMERV